MQRAFLVNLALVMVLNLVVKPFYILGIDAGVQDAVGPATYGTYAALLSLGFLLNILLDLGITNYNTRHIAQHTEQMGAHVGGLAGVRIAFVELRDDIEGSELGESMCLERGMTIRVVSHEAVARRWLIYGD